MSKPIELDTSINIRVSAELRERLEKSAREQYRTPAQEARRLLECGLQEHEGRTA
jgi:predicted DNA-binding protein